MFGEALQAARAISDEGAPATALSALAKRVPEALFGEAVQAARAIADEDERATALAALAEALPDPVREDAYMQAAGHPCDIRTGPACRGASYLPPKFGRWGAGSVRP